MESFMESLNRLKDIHEKEVLGLQNKLLELNSERCRDARRMEELFAKNHQLREQQKALKENVTVLENRLRAGLCDRCVVTQELARKKQHALESSHVQNLQHIFLLTTELTRLKEEKKLLEEELKRLRGLEVRPGARACPTDYSPTSGTPPPPRSSPPSPASEPGFPLDRPSCGSALPHSLLRASWPSVMAFETLKTSVKADRLGFLSRHLALHLRNPRSSPLPPTTAPGGPQPKSLKAVEAKGWEEPTGLLGLPGTMVDPRDPRLEGTLQLFLARQQLRAQAGSARPKGLPVPGGGPPSLPAGSDSEGPEDIEVAGATVTRAAWYREQCSQPTGPGSPRGQVAMAAQEYAPDQPLDLSDRGRSWDAHKPAHCHGSLSPPSTHLPSPESPRGAEPRGQSGPMIPNPQLLSNGTKGPKAWEPEEAPAPVSPPQPFPGQHPSLPSPSGTKNEPRRKPRPLTHQQQPEEGHTESSKAEVQRPESDGRDEPDTSDSEQREVAPGRTVRPPGLRLQECLPRAVLWAQVPGNGRRGRRPSHFLLRHQGGSSAASWRRELPAPHLRAALGPGEGHPAVGPRGARAARGPHAELSAPVWLKPRRQAAPKKSSGGTREPPAVDGGPGSLQDAEDSGSSPSSRGWEET
ncbi:RBBP8 N-terminal-like protein [Orycteropus afer afer]|uniref:RBBP8 N-terminal-like protein n=1 Tax=Orycteropus afer afer TaxID=1230840 RepID=A0A8B7B2K3_ORYAF|nr:RBBP8 N-terminal-like protein [Orycteropus afer afer]